MSKKIFKYPLDIEDVQDVFLPVNSTILSIHKMGKGSTERLCLYAIVDDEEKNEEKVTIEIFGTWTLTGAGVSRKFFGTVILQDGAFVAHVFQRLN